LTAINFSDNLITRGDSKLMLIQSKDSLLDRIFSSRVRIQLLSHFIMRPGERAHIRALSSMIGAQYSAVWKELNNLEAAGLLSSEKVAGRKEFFLNQNSPIIPDLRSILLKTVAAGDYVREALGDLKGLEAAFIFGSFVSGRFDAESDLDIMLIGDLDLSQVTPLIDTLEKSLSREVNYVSFTKEEWNARKSKGDTFIRNVLNDQIIMLIGDEDEF
jgi:predicted nucleotidyltransferase